MTAIHHRASRSDARAASEAAAAARRDQAITRAFEAACEAGEVSDMTLARTWQPTAEELEDAWT